MSLRLKLMLVVIGLCAVASVSVGLATYRSTSSELNTQLDRSLRAAVQQLDRRPFTERSGVERAIPRRTLRDFRASGDLVVQILGPRGVGLASTDVELPVTTAALEVAGADERLELWENVNVGGREYRLLTVGAGKGRGAFRAARDLAEVRSILDGLSRRILLISVLVSLTAGAIGALVAGQLTRKLAHLTSVASEVATTTDTSARVEPTGADEVGRLAAAFNSMLLALSNAREDQQRLVENAGHELRTPLTSIRTNLFTLRHASGLSDDQRVGIIDDLTFEAEELTTLVNEVLDLATFRRDEETPSEVAMGPLVERLARRVADRHGRDVKVQVDDSVVQADPASLARAVSNLVENAIKFDLTDAAVEIECSSGTVTVADRGPGVPPEALGRIFERFYRAEDARSLAGSGLGLAIVAEIVEKGGGRVFAHNRQGGGLVVGFTLPTVTRPEPVGDRTLTDS